MIGTNGVELMELCLELMDLVIGTNELVIGTNNVMFGTNDWWLESTIGDWNESSKDQSFKGIDAPTMSNDVSTADPQATHSAYVFGLRESQLESQCVKAVDKKMANRVAYMGPTHVGELAGESPARNGLTSHTVS